MRRFITLYFLLFTLTVSAQQTEEELATIMAYMKRAMLFNQSVPQEKV